MDAKLGPTARGEGTCGGGRGVLEGMRPKSRFECVIGSGALNYGGHEIVSLMLEAPGFPPFLMANSNIINSSVLCAQRVKALGETSKGGWEGIKVKNTG